MKKEKTVIVSVGSFNNWSITPYSLFEDINWIHKMLRPKPGTTGSEKCHLIKISYFNIISQKTYKCEIFIKTLVK